MPTNYCPHDFPEWQNLKNIIHKAYDHNKEWYYFSRIWCEQNKRGIFLNTLSNFIKNSITLDTNSVIVSPEGLYSNFGATPLAISMAIEIQCFLAFWKEYGDVITGASKMYPHEDSIPKGVPITIIVDVIKRGKILRKMVPDLQIRGWKIQQLISIVHIEEEDTDLCKSISYCERNSVISPQFSRWSFIKSSDI